jgi:hypothetical protein
VDGSSNGVTDAMVNDVTDTSDPAAQAQGDNSDINADCCESCRLIALIECRQRITHLYCTLPLAIA